MAFDIPRGRPITFNPRHPDTFVVAGEALRRAFKRIPITGLLDAETGVVLFVDKPGAPT